MKAIVKNPILKGFNPDPSILRVEDDYYIATSTFEWFPGVQIHHSKDLVNWKLINRPLDRVSQLNMVGNPDSGGIWAPCLSYCDGLFYLIYTDTKAWKEEPYKIAHNYLVTATDIMGPWSEPVYLNSSGFDPSLFHDDDGKKWLVNMVWDHRKNHEFFSHIVLQEYCPKEQKLVGPRKNIFEGTYIGLVEGPHLYKKDGYYYLLTAEGGTMYEHACSIARSKEIDGPYQVHPSNPLISSWGHPHLPIQKSGHGSLVESADGDWYLAHLCGRPVNEEYCILGRETALEPIEWVDDWPFVKGGGNLPFEEWELPCEGGEQPQLTDVTYTFSKDAALDIDFQSLRRAFGEDWISLTARPGWLRLYGQEPIKSLFHQSLIARRLQAFYAEAETWVDFDPEDFQQMAGLTLYYDTRNHYYLRISSDENLGRCLNIIRTDCGQSEEITYERSIPDTGLVGLKMVIKKETFQFYYKMENAAEWTLFGPELSTHIVSDEYDHLGFTGAFIGLCTQDISGRRKEADFQSLSYRENK